VKRLVTRVIATTASVAFGLVAFAAAGSTPVLAQAAGFGSPPSGEVPILFNDQHVYTKPDKLKQGRVLAALVRGSTILVPLRSMFEQMGATVSYDPQTQSVTVTKPGATIQVTVGQATVTINGESRPLDVPPEIYNGSVVVPVRVISEGMGAYVQWVSDKRLVVVRYIAAPIPTPPPTMAPPPPPTMAPRPLPPPPTPTPTLAPTPTPVKTMAGEVFVVGDYVFSPKVYNEFSPGNTGTGSWAGRAAIEFPLSGLAVMAEGDYRTFQYPHNVGSGFNSTNCGIAKPAGAFGDPGCVTVIGGNGATFVPAFNMQDTSVDGRFGIGIASPRIFIVGSYLNQWGNYGYPKLAGFGGGLEKLPDLDQTFSVFGSALYYPSVSGTFIDPKGTSFNLAYRILRYQAGISLAIPSTPIFLEGGLLGDNGSNASNAPGNYSHNGYFAGLGIHF